MLEFFCKDRAPIVALDRATDRRSSQQQAKLCLLSFRDQEGQHSTNCYLQSIASQLPSIGWPPFRIVDVSTAERPPNIATGDRLAPLQKRRVNAGRGELRINVDSLLCDGLKCSFAFDKAGQPCPVCDLRHGHTVTQKLNPQYVTMAERRMKSDAGMFGDVQQMFPIIEQPKPAKQEAFAYDGEA